MSSVSPPKGKETGHLPGDGTFPPCPIVILQNKPTKNFFHFIQDSVNVYHAAGTLVADAGPPSEEAGERGSSEKFKAHV